MKSDEPDKTDEELVPEEVFFGGFFLYAFLLFLFVIVMFLGFYLTRS